MKQKFCVFVKVGTGFTSEIEYRPVNDSCTIDDILKTLTSETIIGAQITSIYLQTREYSFEKFEDYNPVSNVIEETPRVHFGKAFTSPEDIKKLGYNSEEVLSNFEGIVVPEFGNICAELFEKCDRVISLDELDKQYNQIQPN